MFLISLVPANLHLTCISYFKPTCKSPFVSRILLFIGERSSPFVICIVTVHRVSEQNPNEQRYKRMRLAIKVTFCQAFKSQRELFISGLLWDIGLSHIQRVGGLRDCSSSNNLHLLHTKKINQNFSLKHRIFYKLNQMFPRFGPRFEKT